MKSFFLENVESIVAAEWALRSVLPGQERPWLLKDGKGDVIAYFNASSTLDGNAILNIQADISGRHFNEDEAVLSVLRSLQTYVGGSITNDS